MAILAQDVKDLLSGCSVDDIIVEAIIVDATNAVTGMWGDCDILSDAEKEAVIKWFAAHMLASGPCKQAKREKLGEAEVEYDQQTGLDLTSTSYGRMAMALDRCGKLNTANKQGIRILAVTSFK
jgi:hypothetical protein